MRSFSRLAMWVIVPFICYTQSCSQQTQKEEPSLSRQGQNESNDADKKFISDVEKASKVATIDSYLQILEPGCIFAEHFLEQNKDPYKIADVKSPIFQNIGRDGLTKENAVVLALINNPELFAYYENLEIGNAGLIEAGLRQNPVISSQFRFPGEPGKEINRVFETAVSFLDYFLLPLREMAALADLEVIKAEVQQRVLDLVRDVQINWIELRISQLRFDKEAAIVELREVAAQIAKLQKNAGNINGKAKDREISFQIAKEKLKDSQANISTAKEKLSRSLGLFGNETCFKISGGIDWKSDFILTDLNVLENAAIMHRPDVEAIRQEINAIAQEAKLKEWWTYSNIKVGNSSEKAADGSIVSGPSIEFAVPVFNWGQAEQLKYGAMIEQAQKKLLAKAVQACSEVREFFKTAHIYQSQLENFETNIFPEFANQLESTLAHYNVMTLGIFDLLDLKENEIKASIDHLNALEQHEKAKIELLHAVGGSIASTGDIP